MLSSVNEYKDKLAVSCPLGKTYLGVLIPGFSGVPVNVY
jgi:hypothetical protein